MKGKIEVQHSDMALGETLSAAYDWANSQGL